MKFIIDAQLPQSLSDFLKSKGHDSIHTIELSEPQDYVIMDIALSENRIVVSKDNDFLESFLISGRPKKLIIVRTGNIKNTDLMNLFKVNLDIILSLLQENSLLEINRNEIVVHS